MSDTVVTVDAADESLSDLLERLRKRPESIVVTQNGQPVARLTPVVERKGNKEAFAEFIRNSHLTDEEADSWLQDIKEGRDALIPQPDRWQ